MIEISQNGYSISWGYDNANKSKIKAITNNDNFVGNDRFTNVKNIASEVIYENVYNNIDLQYFVTSTGVKENIILHNADAQNEFNITYQLKHLTPKQSDEHTITLYNGDNEPVYSIIAPFMTDNNGESSVQLQMKIVSLNGANMKVKLIADYDFIHSANRSFPITIDPEITNKFSSELYLDEVYGNSALNHGPYYLSNDHYIFAKLSELPELDEGEKIISAKYNFEIKNGSSLFANETDSPIIINAHKLNGVENGIVSYDSDILDYDSISYNDNSKFTFDLTKLTKEWYDNGDNVDGFVIEGLDTAESRIANIKEATRTSATPSITIIYKDFSGTESNFSYHTIPAGYNAQAKVSDYLGNLVISQKLYEGTGARMPVTISATYNSIKNSDTSGCGWRFSFEQCIKESSSTLANAGYNYIYIDTEGTKHYLKKHSEEEKWSDEDGLGITLSINESNIVVETELKTQTYELVSAGGKLLTETDKNGNTITYSYSDGYLQSITDGSGRVIQLSYSGKPDGSKRVNQLTLPDNERISILYNSSSVDTISGVVFPNALASTYRYDNNNKLNNIQLENRSNSPSTVISKNLFTYNAKGQITKITEYGKSNSEGQYLNITYSNDNTTTFEDRKGLKTTYTFDNKGVLMSVLNANGYLESNYTSGLSNAGGADSFTKNLLTETYEFDIIGSNSYYRKSNGNINGVQSTGGICEIDSSNPTVENGNVQYFGSNSIKISNPRSENNSSFYTSAWHNINMADNDYIGKELTFSAYVKTNDVCWKNLDEAFGALLEIKFYDFYANLLDEKTSIGITETEDWQRISLTVTVPQETRIMCIMCSVKNTTGTAWFDCLQLEEGNCANDFNALQNCDFESNDYWLTNDNEPISAQEGIVSLGGTAGVYVEPTTTAEDATTDNNENIELPTYCDTITETIPYDTVITYDDYGNPIKTEEGFVVRTLKNTYLSASDTESTTSDNSEVELPQVTYNLGNAYIYQNVQVKRAGVMFNIVGEAMANSVPLNNELRTFGIALNIYYDNENEPETHYQEFNPCTKENQTVSMSVSPYDSGKIINYVSFAFVYSNNCNVMKIKNAMLNIATTEYSPYYDSENNIDGDNTDVSDDTTNEDNSEDFLISSEVVTQSVDKNQTYMQTSKTYDNTGNYVTSETNKAGDTVTYTYDINGNVTSTTDAENCVVNYEYDNSGNIQSVYSEEAVNYYFYNDRNIISEIEHNNFKYKFNYDVWGNLVSTYIGNASITNNTYSENNGALIKTTYANGDYLEYFYDTFGNITKIVGKSGTIAEFVYNKKGLISKSIDKSVNRTTYYYYDFSKNIINYYCESEDGNLSYNINYNKDGNKVEKTNIKGYEKIITSGANNGSEFVSSDGITVSGISDSFGRTTQVITTREQTNSTYSTSYTYENGKYENSTTDIIKSLTHKYCGNELVKYEYSYDANGNITNVKQDNSTIAVYSYDHLNQLIYAADSITGLYTQIIYDNAGNITKVKEYTLNTNGWIPDSLLSEKNYSYSDENWKDKLTSYNGTNITYDEIGNPLSYRDGMTFTWENGRNLSTVSKGNNTVNMQYDANGLRTKKEDNDYATQYYYDINNNLIAMYMTSNIVHFYYDANGNVTAMKNNDLMYYYVKNLQGDIVKLIDENGNVKANYTYDALGNITSIKNGAGLPVPKSNVFHIANINPFRYRGYVYDSETGLYYLQSRYYDPVTGRFLNADYMQFLTSKALFNNLYVYCNNNYTNVTDPFGTSGFHINTVPPMIKPIPKEILDEITKYKISLLATAFLDSKKYYIAKNMFLHSLYYEGTDLAPNVKEMIVKAALIYPNFISTIIKNAKHNTFCIDFEFTTGDLYYSLQHVLVSSTWGKNHNGKYLQIKIYDKYDFTQWRKLNSFGNIANDFGYILTKIGYLSEYIVNVSFTYYV